MPSPKKIIIPIFESSKDGEEGYHVTFIEQGLKIQEVLPLLEQLIEQIQEEAKNAK